MDKRAEREEVEGTGGFYVQAVLHRFSELLLDEKLNSLSLESQPLPVKKITPNWLFGVCIFI